MAKTKPATKPKVKQQFVAVIHHSHPDGPCTYVCKTLKVAQVMAAKIAVDALSEFDEDSFVPGDARLSKDGMVQKALDCFQAALDGNYPLVVDLYTGIDPTIHIGIDPKVSLDDKAETFDKKELRNQLAKFIAIRNKGEARGKEETQSEETKASGGDSSSEAEEQHAATGGVSDRGDGSYSDPTR